MRSATTTGIGWCATAAGSSNAGRCSATTRQDYGRRSSATTRRPPGELAGELHQRLRDDASLGGLRRNLGALPAHRGHPGDGGSFGIRVDPSSTKMVSWRRRSISTPTRLATPAVDRCLAAADLRAQQPQPLHGPERPLSVRPLSCRCREARLHPPPDPCAARLRIRGELTAAVSRSATEAVGSYGTRLISP